MSLSGTAIHTEHDAIEIVQGTFFDAVHDQDVAFGELRASAEYVPIDGLGVTLSVPVRAMTSDITYRDRDGNVIEPDVPDTHHRDESLAGVGDATVGVHTIYGPIGVRVGLSVPLGRTEHNPFTPIAQTMRHQHVQFGTGTFDPSIAVEFEHPFRRVRAGAWAMTQQVLYESGKGYQAGDRYAGGVSGVIHFGARAWTLQLGAELQKTTAERWDGVVNEDEGNAGRLDVLIGGSVARALTDKLAITGSVSVPVYTDVTGAQIEYPAIIGIGLRASLEPDRHRMATPVAGKITVVDYWASWCAPCGDLDRRLHALLEQYPDRLAVTRIQVDDADFALPRVKVFAADGSLLFDASGNPPELEKRIRDALAP